MKIRNIRQKFYQTEVKTELAVRNGRKRLVRVFTSQRGDGYIPDAMRILIACVLGTLLLAALIVIFKTVVIPKTTNNISSAFDTASNTTLN